MARPSRKLHELIPKRRGEKTYVWHGNRWVYLGKWEGDAPSDAAIKRFNEYKELWKIDPKAKAKSKSDTLLCELWEDWLNSPEGPMPDSRRDVCRTERLLFGTQDAPNAFATMKVSEFTAPGLRAWQSHLCQLKDHKGKLRLSRDTLRRCVHLVQKCFKWGAVGGVVDQNHAASLLFVEPPAKGKVKECRRIASVDKATSERVIPFLSPPLQTAIKLLWLTTARPSEILGLKGEDSEDQSAENQYHRIRRTGCILLRGGARLDLEHEGVWAAVLDEHKTAGKGFERVIFFGPKAQEILRPIVGTVGYLFKPAEGRVCRWAKRERKLKVGKGCPGQIYTSDTLANSVKHACERAKIGHYSPYQIRHTASAAIMDSHGKEAASVYMGHKPSGITANYTGNNLRLAAKVAREVG